MIRLLLQAYALTLTAFLVSAAPLELNMRRLVETETGQGQWKTVESRVEWNAAHTCVVV